jgi:hypothetical protein
MHTHTQRILDDQRIVGWWMFIKGGGGVLTCDHRAATPPPRYIVHSYAGRRVADEERRRVDRAGRLKSIRLQYEHIVNTVLSGWVSVVGGKRASRLESESLAAFI